MPDANPDATADAAAESAPTEAAPDAAAVATSEAAPDAAPAGDGGRPTPEQLLDVLRDIEDPELRMSIVELGLIYHVDIDDDGLVNIDLTLTTPACPIGPMLQGQAYHMLTQMDGVEDVEVNLVWDPPWDPKTMASEEVRMALGIW
ncbi:MAG: iron-sulfur cluster assembly protein [Chloroflexi bacterium]|nr:iron-sulfur cluster assembly protein [Chloroflexota bacterium]